MMVFDLREALIPFTLLNIINAFHKMALGDTMDIVAEDDSVTADIQRILPPAAYDIVSAQAAGEAGCRTYRLRLLKIAHCQPTTIKENPND